MGERLFEGNFPKRKFFMENVPREFSDGECPMLNILGIVPVFLWGILRKNVRGMLR